MPYKVVGMWWLDNKLLRTSIMCDGPYTLEDHDPRLVWKLYQPGVWTVADELLWKRGYGLTCFNELNEAMAFVKIFNTLLPKRFLGVYECVVGTVKKKPPARVVCVRQPTTCLVSARSTILNDNDEIVLEYGEWPAGTLVTNCIKLLEPYGG